MYSDAHIQRFYYQGVDAVIRVIHRLEDQLEYAHAQLISKPESVIAPLRKELQTVKRTLAHKNDELLRERQLDHQLRRRIHELEREFESNAPRVERDPHNSSLPPALDLPWKKVKRTRRGKAAMDEIGILPQFKGTLVRDGFSSYQWYGQCRHSLCNAHLLRDLLFVTEVSPEQEVWTKPLSKLLLSMKKKVGQAKTPPEAELSQRVKTDFLRRYDRLVRRADRLNPPRPKGTATRAASKRNSPLSPTPGSLIERLQRQRDEILRFMTDTSVPFDNNGSERDLRMVKLQQKISGCFRTPDGARSFCRVRSYLSTARKHGHYLLYSLERVFNGKPLVFQ